MTEKPLVRKRRDKLRDNLKYLRINFPKTDFAYREIRNTFWFSKWFDDWLLSKWKLNLEITHIKTDIKIKLLDSLETKVQQSHPQVLIVDLEF